MRTSINLSIISAASILLSAAIPIQICVAQGRYGFTGQGMEPPTGLTFHRLRYYDPETGTFISRDPVGHQGGLNLYSYVLANPINLIDPNGDAPILVPLLVSGTIGGVLGGLGAGAITLATTGDWNKTQNAALIGTATGFVTGSGLGLVGVTYGAGTIGAGSAIASSAVISAAGAGVNNAATQASFNLIDGQSFSQSLSNIDTGQVAASQLIGGGTGFLGGGATVGAIALNRGAQNVQTTMAANLAAYERYLIQTQGASPATIASVQSSVMSGMAQVGGTTAPLTLGLSTTADVILPLGAPFIESAASQYFAPWLNNAFASLNTRFARDQSGVLIDKAAELVGSNLADIKGATYDPDSNQIIFLGSNSTPGVEGIDMDYFYTAVQAVYGSAIPPYVSLDAPASAASLWQDLGDGDGSLEAQEWGGFTLRYNPLWAEVDSNVAVRVKCKIGATNYDFNVNFTPQTIDWLQYPNGQYPMHLVFSSITGTAPPGISVWNGPFTTLPYPQTVLDYVNTSSNVSGGQDWTYPFQLYNGGTGTITNISFAVIPDRQHRRFGGRLEGTKLGWV